MNPLGSLACLWLCQAAFVAGEVSLLLQFDRRGGGIPPDALGFAYLFAPGIVLAPLVGPLLHSVPKHWVILASAWLGFLAALCFTLGVLPPATCWIVAASSSAAFRVALWTLLPAAVPGRASMAQVNALFEIGWVGALVARPLGMELLGQSPLFVPCSLGCYVVVFLAALPLGSIAAVDRAARPRDGRQRFFSDAQRILANPNQRLHLLVVVAANALVVHGFWFVLARSLVDWLWLIAGGVGGAAVMLLQKHPRRLLTLVPVAMLLLVPWWWNFWRQNPALLALLGVLGVWSRIPPLSVYQTDCPPNARGNAMAVLVALADAAMWGIGAVLIHMDDKQSGEIMTLLTVFGALLTAYFYFREIVEQLAEILLWPLYRIRGRGPGLVNFPMNGPLVIIANHSSYCDPMFLAKVLPRRLIPMMTSVFFDLPGMRWLMTKVARAIRVEASGFRREVPEIKQAVAALDRGELLVVFPEGALRKREDLPLKQFGQGIWRILHERPETPVIVCWIEGTWGSYFSYWNGPPTKGKKLDFWRTIQVAVSAPQVLSSEVLADHRTTRTYLMQECLDARKYLNLPPLTLERVEDEASDRPTAEEPPPPAGG